MCSKVGIPTASVGATQPNQGFTLIEALIYIVLFTFIIGAGVASAFYLIQDTDDLRREAFAEAEANFVLRRIDNLISGATSVSIISGGEGISVGGSSIELDDANNQVTFDGGAGAIDLLSGHYDIDLQFSDVTNPASGVEVLLILNGNTFHKIYYLR